MDAYRALLSRGAGRRQSGRYASPVMGFAWVRLIAAGYVVVDHSVPLTDAGWRLATPPWTPVGYVALMAFFAMGGYQISQSWVNQSSWWRFMALRMLRIWPPLMVVVVLSAFVIGPLVTVLSQREYWSSPLTWGYVVNNSGVFGVQHLLPGVFPGNPLNTSVNGAIWTIPMEFVGYVIVLVLGLAGALAGRSRVLLFPVLAVLAVLDVRFQADYVRQDGAGGLLGVSFAALVSFLVPLLLGMVLYAYRDRIPLRPWIAVVLMFLHVICTGTAAGQLTLPLMASYGSIVLATHWPARLSVHPRWVFGSYGLYLWGFLVQQILVWRFDISQAWLLTLIALPISYALGVLSWVLVEEPTQELRKYLRVRRRIPMTHPAAAPVPRPVEVAGVPAG